MKVQYPIDFGFYPKTWIIPHQLTKLKSDMGKDKASDRHPTLIVKPSEGAQGRGIFFINDYDKLKDILQLDNTKKLLSTNYVV